ncbi:MAG: penicillin-binding protein 2, partial [Pseudomonadota bacterium]
DFAHVLGYVAKASEADLERLSEGANAQERSAIRRLFKHPDMRTGRSGVERYAEEWLRGEAGFRKLETNAAGRIIREFDDPTLSPRPGRDLYLTVDAELQKFAIDRFGVESGAAVVLDIETGEILAFVSTPAFDPNDFVNGISTEDYAVLRDDVEYSPLYHKAYDGTYPPGSTFKMVVASAALEAGVIDPNERIYCPGHYRFGNNTWHCWKKRGHGAVNMHWAIKSSCDTYFYEVARRMGIEHLSEVAKRFGFGQRWELGLMGGRSGVVPNDAWKRAARGEPWFEGETLNVGIGQGQVSTTPLQLAVMTARIAAEGKIVTPRIIGEGPRPESDIPYDAPLDPEIMQRMKAGMFGVTSEAGGTALRSGDLGLGGPRLAGKTGTSQVRRISAQERATGILEGDQIARRLRDHALFVAYAPHDDPKYAISVIVEHGEGGSKAAAPVARDILAEALRIDSRRSPAYTQTASLGDGFGPGGGGRDR